MADKKIQHWQNRIVGHGEKPAKEFNFNPQNWRSHPKSQRVAINDVLAKIGWVTGVIINKFSGNLIDGHLRVEETLAKDENALIPFIEVELSADEEAKILAVLDPLSAMAETDAEKFLALTEMFAADFQMIAEMRESLDSSPVNLDDFFSSLEETDFVPQGKIVLEYTHEKCELVKAALKNLGDNPSEVVARLLNL